MKEPDDWPPPPDGTSERHVKALDAARAARADAERSERVIEDQLREFIKGRTVQTAGEIRPLLVRLGGFRADDAEAKKIIDLFASVILNDDRGAAYRADLVG